MQAVIQSHYGSADVLGLEQRPLPEPDADQIRVRIHAAPVTAADSLMRQGVPRFARLFLGLRAPRHPVPGTGFSGVVDAVGPRVSRFQVGDAIMGESVFGAGTHASHVCLSEQAVITHKPDTISHAEASSICDGPLTSWNFLHRLARIESGQQVLINGAAGSLGSAAVQLAALAGAHVTAVCSAANEAHVRALGAEHVIDYTANDPLPSDRQYDIIFDTVGKLDIRRALSRLSAEGRFLSPVLSGALLLRLLSDRLSRRHRVHFSATGVLPPATLKPMLATLTTLLADGKLRMHVDRRYALSDIAEAHALVDEGHKRGTVVVEP